MTSSSQSKFCNYERQHEGVYRRLCNECRDSCTEMVGHCLELGGRHAGREHIGLLIDCAEICASSSGFMLRESKHHKTVCTACAEVCRACAESCRSIGGGDEMMTHCAEVCERCAESCERMAGQSA